EALVVRGLLESEGIRVVLQSRLAQSVYPFSVGDQAEVVLLVAAADLPRARTVLAREREDTSRTLDHPSPWGLRPALLQLLAQRLGARAQLRVRGHLVDEARRLRLLRGILAVEVPGLLGPLAAHRVLEIPRAEARVVGAHRGAHLAKRRLLARHREVAHVGEHVAAAHREAVDHRDDRHRHHVDQGVSTVWRRKVLPLSGRLMVSQAIWLFTSKRMSV